MDLKMNPFFLAVISKRFLRIYKRVFLHLKMDKHWCSPHSNVSGGCDKHDGVFTAPVDGVYVFFCKMTQGMNNDEMFYQFILNGSSETLILLYGRSNYPYRTSSSLIALQLSRGDRVWIRMYEGGGLLYGNNGGGDQSFSGFML